MKTIPSLLTLLLACQLLLTGSIFAYHRQVQAAHAQNTTLMSFSKDSIDAVIISEKDHKITIKKVEGHWILPDLAGLPADDTKVQSLIDHLASLKGGWPVARTLDSQDQFEVSDKKFSRKIDLLANDKAQAELLMGTSPSFRKTHVRSPQDDAIYAVELSSAEVPATAKDWLDHSLIAVKNPSIIEGKDFRLEKSEQTWKLQGTGTLNVEKAEALAHAFESLQVDSFETEPTANKASLRFSVASEGKEFTYDLHLLGNKVQIKRSDRKEVFSLPKTTYDLLATFTHQSLTQAPSKPSITKESQPPQDTPSPHS